MSDWQGQGKGTQVSRARANTKIGPWLYAQLTSLFYGYSTSSARTKERCWQIVLKGKLSVVTWHQHLMIFTTCQNGRLVNVTDFLVLRYLLY